VPRHPTVHSEPHPEQQPAFTHLLSPGPPSSLTSSYHAHLESSTTFSATISNNNKQPPTSEEKRNKTISPPPWINHAQPASKPELGTTRPSVQHDRAVITRMPVQPSRSHMHTPHTGRTSTTPLPTSPHLVPPGSGLPWLARISGIDKSSLKVEKALSHPQRHQHQQGSGLATSSPFKTHTLPFPIGRHTSHYRPTQHRETGKNGRKPI
jgi:hypothetical protein